MRYGYMLLGMINIEHMNYHYIKPSCNGISVSKQIHFLVDYCIYYQLNGYLPKVVFLEQAK